MLVRVTLALAVGPRQAGIYLVDDDEARALAAVVHTDDDGNRQPALVAISPVVPQADYDDDDIYEAVHDLELSLIPAAGDTDVGGATPELEA